MTPEEKRTKTYALFQQLYEDFLLAVREMYYTLEDAQHAAIELTDMTISIDFSDWTKTFPFEYCGIASVDEELDEELNTDWDAIAEAWNNAAEKSHTDMAQS